MLHLDIDSNHPNHCSCYRLHVEGIKESVLSISVVEYKDKIHRNKEEWDDLYLQIKNWIVLSIRSITFSC